MLVGQAQHNVGTQGPRQEARQYLSRHRPRYAAPESRARRAIDIDQYDRAFLRMRALPEYDAGVRRIRFADLFCGCGGMSLGVLEAARTLGLGAQVELAIDNDIDALTVYRNTFAVDR